MRISSWLMACVLTSTFAACSASPEAGEATVDPDEWEQVDGAASQGQARINPTKHRSFKARLTSSQAQGSEYEVSVTQIDWKKGTARLDSRVVRRAGQSSKMDVGVPVQVETLRTPGGFEFVARVGETERARLVFINYTLESASLHSLEGAGARLSAVSTKSGAITYASCNLSCATVDGPPLCVDIGASQACDDTVVFPEYPRCPYSLTRAADSCAAAEAAAVSPPDALWNSKVTSLKATSRGGMPRPLPEGSSCQPSHETFELDTVSRRLSWTVCTQTEAEGPFRFVSASRTVSSSEVQSVATAVSTVTVSTSEFCGMDRPTLTLTLSEGANAREYHDVFYSCMGPRGRTFVDNIHEPFAALRALARTE